MKKDLLNIVQKVVHYIDDKSGTNIVALDLGEVTSICDYFIIASGSSSRQVKAIVDELEDRLLLEDIKLIHKEGYDSARWVLLDYGDIIIHVFHNEDRMFYNLEGIWKDADKVSIDINNQLE